MKREFEQPSELVENFCFHSEKDRQIAHGLRERLGKRRESEEITIERYEKAIEGLELLIPKRNTKGLRIIADIVLTPAKERLIQSRLDAKEIDVTTPDGHFGKLPEKVKQEIAKESNLNLEMTNKCTNNCNFCLNSKKGPISEKMSLSCIQKIMDVFWENKPKEKQHRCHYLYNLTDPFDAKWIDNSGKEYDFYDVFKMYWKTMRGLMDSLFVSTAVPIGEELRVLNFAGRVLESYQLTDGKLARFINLRISRTNPNNKRVEAIQSVLEGLYENPTDSKEYVDSPVIIVTDNRNEDPLPLGDKWDSIDFMDITTADIFGINRTDGVLIGTDGIWNKITEAVSNENKFGEATIPVEVDMGIKSEYKIVHFQYFPRFSDPVTTKFIYENNKKLVRKIEDIQNMPNRTFLQLVILSEMTLFKFKAKNMRDLSEEGKREFVKKNEESIVSIIEYMNQKDWSNKSMLRFFLDLYVGGFGKYLKPENRVLLESSG